MRLSFKYNDKEVFFDVCYRKRKTMEIKVGPPNNITVISPKGLTQESIMKMVEKKKNWIIKKLDLVENIETRTGNKEITEDEIFLYLGNAYNLKLVEDCDVKKIKISSASENLYVRYANFDKAKLKGAIELWYREMGQKIISERVSLYQKYFNILPKKIQIKEQKRRWGSCTSDNKLLFNWRIIMAPLEVIDYIVVHEICHMIEKNHSKNYWNLVRLIMPNYKEYKKWLKENGYYLDI
ncbi:MAG: M48 family metallopeptidase [Eubacteriaceae bacterium]